MLAAARGWARLLVRLAAWALLVTAGELLLATLVPAVGGWHSSVVMSGSMRPAIEPGDVVVLQPVRADGLRPGQIVQFTGPDGVRTIVHRVLDRDRAGNFVTRGDANPTPDGMPLPPAKVIALARLRIPYIGLPVLWWSQHRPLPLAATFGSLLAALAVVSVPARRATATSRPGRHRFVRSRRSSAAAGPERGGSGPGRWSAITGRLLVIACALVLVTALGVPRATAAFHGFTSGAASTFTAAPTFPTYPQAVLADSPLFYHRLNEGTGVTSFADATGNGRPATGTDATAIASYSTATGPAVGGTAITTDGTGGIVSTETATSSPATFTLELWFKTAGSGKLVGMGGVPTGNSTTYDRHVYVDSGGMLTFGVTDSGVPDVVRSVTPVNDNAWHHMVATAGAGTLALYLDGALQASAAGNATTTYWGFWRTGGDTLDNTWPNAPASGYIAATIDEVAVYPTALDATRVSAHYAAATAAAYGAAVLADSPWLYWRFGPTDPDRFTDASGHGRSGEFHLGPPIVPGQPGALAAPDNTDGAVRLDGTRAKIYNGYTQTNPNTFTEEVWFKTTTQVGGQLMGFGDATSGTSGYYDRLVYMLNGGRLAFGIFNTGAQHIVFSSGSYNDGAWHYVAASLGPAGMRLHVDGLLVAQDPAWLQGQGGYGGHWHLGYDNLVNWAQTPWSMHFTGYVDEWAVYPAQLSTSQISVHYGAGK